MGSDNKIMLQGFSDDLDSLFANLAKGTTAFNPDQLATPAIQHPALAVDDAIVMTSTDPQPVIPTNFQAAAAA